MDAWFNCATASGTLLTEKILYTVTRLGTERFKAASNGWRILPRTDSYPPLIRQLLLRLPPDKNPESERISS